MQKHSLAERPVPKRASTQDIWTGAAKQNLIEAVENYDLSSKTEWSALDELSSATEFEGMQVFAEDAIFKGSDFVAPATVYVKLRYGEDSAEPVTFSDSFPASVTFNVASDGDVEINRIEIDTNSFFNEDQN
jgi:Predicted pPIWI-associating nuclease